MDIRKRDGSDHASRSCSCAARSAPVVQIHFPADLGGPTASYVTASQAAIRVAVQKFLGEQPPPPAPAPPQPSGSGSKSGSKKNAPQPEAPPPLIDSSALGQHTPQLGRHEDEERQADARLPRLLPDEARRRGSTLTDTIHARPRSTAPAATSTTATRWSPRPPPTDTRLLRRLRHRLDGPADPPQPDETKTINGQEYLESWDEDRLRLVGLEDGQSLLLDRQHAPERADPGQMLGIAESMRKYTGRGRRRAESPSLGVR